MPGESKTSPRRIEAAQRQKQALELRLGGASFDQIAASLGYADKSSAYRAVMAALKRVPAAEVMEYRRLNLERLNRMRLQNWPHITSGDHKAMGMELSIQERESRYLGLDAPTKIAPTTPEGKPYTLMDLLALAAEEADGTDEGKGPEGV